MIDAKRLPDWRSRLAAVLTIGEGTPFAWGSHDCFLGLAVPAIEALIGVDLGAEYRGAYNSAEGATAALAARGFHNLADAAAAHFPEIPPARAHVGDLVLIATGDPRIGDGLGVVIGERVIVLSEKGQGSVALRRASRAFRVG